MFLNCRGLTFQKAYRDVGDLVVHLSVPVLALTATITKHMQQDIFSTLHLDSVTCMIVAEIPNRYFTHSTVRLYD